MNDEFNDILSLYNKKIMADGEKLSLETVYNAFLDSVDMEDKATRDFIIQALKDLNKYNIQNKPNFSDQLEYSMRETALAQLRELILRKENHSHEYHRFEDHSYVHTYLTRYKIIYFSFLVTIHALVKEYVEEREKLIHEMAYSDNVPSYFRELFLDTAYGIL